MKVIQTQSYAKQIEKYSIFGFFEKEEEEIKQFGVEDMSGNIIADFDLEPQAHKYAIEKSKRDGLMYRVVDRQPSLKRRKTRVFSKS